MNLIVCVKDLVQQVDGIQSDHIILYLFTKYIYIDVCLLLMSDLYVCQYVFCLFLSINSHSSY